MYRSITRRVGDAVRLAEVIQVLVRHGFADIVRRLGLHEGIPAKLLRGLHLIEAAGGEPETAGKRLRAALTELGPTAVKFGQILSTRPDVIGADIAADLHLLQDRVDTLPFDEIRPVLEGELGGRLEELFEEFDPVPVAAASLSQVYSAVVRPGRRVAVKVQRPGVRKVIEADLSLMQAIAEWIAEHIGDLAWMNVPGMVAEFKRSITRELDFTVEARTIERFRKNYETTRDVFIPKTYPRHCAARVLTMDWIDGIRVDALDGFRERGCVPAEVARIGCDTLCRQVFEFRLFHADPHPGNILVTRNNQVAFLDYGMVGSLEQADTVAMADLLRAILREDAEGTVRALVSFTTAGDIENPDAMIHEVADYIAFDAQAIIAQGEVGKAIERLTEILRRYQLQLAPRFSLLLKAVCTIESTGRALDPDMNMIPVIRPYIERIVAERYSPVQLLREARENAALLVEVGRDIPSDVRNLLRMLRRGRLKIQLNHQGLEELAAETDRASNRVTLGLITGAIIVGSSMLFSAGTGARPIGLAGFIVAGILGFAIIISILRTRNF